MDMLAAIISFLYESKKNVAEPLIPINPKIAPRQIGLFASGITIRRKKKKATKEKEELREILMEILDKK